MSTMGTVKLRLFVVIIFVPLALLFIDFYRVGNSLQILPPPLGADGDNGNKHATKRTSVEASVSSNQSDPLSDLAKQFYLLDTTTTIAKGNITTTTDKSVADGSSSTSMQSLALEKLSSQNQSSKSLEKESTYFTQLDIMVPLSGGDDKLRAFATTLGETIRQNQIKRSNAFITVRLLVTRYQGDDSTPVFQKELQALGVPDVVFVTMPPTVAFERAAARNALHRIACTRLNCVAAGMDVDMKVRVDFFDRAPRIVVPGKVAYFPIVWSEVNPETVKEVERYLNVTLDTFSQHRGSWRPVGFGMYAVAGPDIAYLRFNESFVGWGGEDNDFYQTVAKQMEVKRANETGLIHTWHKKECTEGQATEIFELRCLEAKWIFEGSMLGQSLMISHKKFPNKPRRLKPLFIIHVGPATSQSETMHRQLTELSPYLAMDNFTYHGKLWKEDEDQRSPLLAFMHNQECFKKGAQLWERGSPNDTPCLRWPKEIKSLDLTQNHIVSDESFGNAKGLPFHMPSLKKLLYKFDVRVVVSYKHYFEWLLDSKHLLSKSWGSGSRWSNKGGLPMMSVYEWMDGILSQTSTRPELTNRNPKEVFDTLSLESPTQFLNYHEAKTDPVSHWLCTMLPMGAAAPNACEQSLKLNEQYAAEESKPSISVFEYDRLAWEAFERGLIQKGLDRRFVAAAARKYVEVDLNSSLTSFHMECPTDDQLSRLFDQSLGLEKEIFPYHFNEEDHRAAFDVARDGHAFCSISTERMLDKASWADFFGNLTKTFVVTEMMQREMGYGKQRQTVALNLKAQRNVRAKKELKSLSKRNGSRFRGPKSLKM